MKQPDPISLSQLARDLPADAWQTVVWREGTKGPLTSRFAAVRVRPSAGYQHSHGPREEVLWLLVEWPAAEVAPCAFWFATLPPETPLQELVRQAKRRWWIEQGYQQLKDELGLDHYEDVPGRAGTTTSPSPWLPLVSFNWRPGGLKKTSGPSRLCLGCDVSFRPCLPSGPVRVPGAAIESVVSRTTQHELNLT